MRFFWLRGLGKYPPGTQGYGPVRGYAVLEGEQHSLSVGVASTGRYLDHANQAANAYPKLARHVCEEKHQQRVVIPD